MARVCRVWCVVFNCNMLENTNFMEVAILCMGDERRFSYLGLIGIDYMEFNETKISFTYILLKTIIILYRER